MQRLLLFILTLALVIGGCAAGPQYIPASLEGEPKESLAELRVDLRVEFLKVDRRVAIIRETYLDPDPIFLTPGNHILTYRVYGETVQWHDFIRTMKVRNFTLSADGKLFVKSVGSIKLTQRADAVDRYGWIDMRKEVFLEAGKVHKLSEL
jgi:hypothetical protein